VIQFRVESTDGHARAGVLVTPHGEVPTPAFMPVGTQASVKSLDPGEVEATGARMVIMNTYHLWLRPGPEVVAEHGGLHGFSRMNHAIATDSGGFQAFSLAERVKLDEDGFEFSSHLDGTRLRLSPEESMRVQGLLGSDVAMQLDVCPPGEAPRDVVVSAVERTTRWAERCLAARREGQAVFGIVQGGTHVDLRTAHAEALGRLALDGLALGGFSVGEPPERMHETLVQVTHRLDGSRIRYLMGVGTPSDLVRAIGTGVDLFDCVMPTRNARNGQVFVTGGKLSVKHAAHRWDTRPLDEKCECSTCRTGFSRSYLRHLFVAGELLAHQLLTVHNLHFYARLVADARSALLEGRYREFAEEKLSLAARATEGEDSG
jgi:queuine tRNA-ribosyltransferase